MKQSYLWYGLVSVIIVCTIFLYKGVAKNMDTAPTTLVNVLLKTSYTDLFMVMGEEKVHKIWMMPGAASQLYLLINNPSVDMHARFLAAEILYKKDSAFPNENEKESLASIYAAALAGDFIIGDAGPWVLPGFPNSVGLHVISLGTYAVPEFIKLLDDERLLIFSGSEEATIGNSYRYRVKDVAVELLTKIKGISYTPKKTAAGRNVEIEKLKAQLSG